METIWVIESLFLRQGFTEVSSANFTSKLRKFIHLQLHIRIKIHKCVKSRETFKFFRRSHRYPFTLRKNNKLKGNIMEIILSEKQMDIIAIRTANRVVNLLRVEDRPKPRKKYIGIKEAAGILGISEYHLRRIKDQFPHIKRGDNQQGRIYFDEDALLANFIK